MSLLGSQNQSTLLALKASLPKVEVPPVVYKDVVKGEWYATTRHGQTIKVVIDEVKRATVKIKRSVESKDSETLKRDKLDQYYVKLT